MQTQTAPNAPPAQPCVATHWHAVPVAEALARLESNEAGLRVPDAARRLTEQGPNRLPSEPPRSALRRFLAQFANVLIYMLLAAAAVTAVLGHPTDSAVILGVVLINAIIGFVQEGRAERALEAIRGMLTPTASVLREGRRMTLDAAELVAGDIVLLEAGDRVPADLRITRSRGLRIEEAVLTGESVPVEKNAEPVALEAVLGDRAAMAFSGTLVVAGSGAGVVVATGRATELGRISGLIGGVAQVSTPLLRQMDTFARGVTAVVLIASALIFAFAWLVRGFGAEEALLAVVGIAVAAIPEGLPAVLTITLAIGVRRMAARHAIIRHLPAVETLGAVSIICSDKTGTLTRNEMMVEAAETTAGRIAIAGEGYAPTGTVTLGGEPPPPDVAALLAELARAAALCNNAALREEPGGTWTVSGDPMEGALLAFAARAGETSETSHIRFPRRDEIPFDSRHRFMATLHAGHEDAFACVKGAPERLLAMCDRQRGLAGEQPLDASAWHARAESLAAGGMRVIAVATRGCPHSTDTLTPEMVESGLVLVGLLGLIDPPRDEAVAAVAECQAAGIRVKMITGDHAATAGAIARVVGLRGVGDVVTGGEIDRLDDAALRTRARQADVFARTSPEHKLRLVEALQAEGGVVAMTGDGVNDAPALKRADVGVAMGRKGTEAAKEASEMVLADDNFATLAAAVREGRTVYENLRKVIAWTLPTNGGEALTIVAAILLGLTLPLTPVQILWVNMVTAVTLGLVLAFEPAEAGIMRRPPRPPREPLLSGLLVWRIVFVSILFALAVFAMSAWSEWRGLPLDAARTAAVNTLVVLEIAYLFSVRDNHRASFTWRGAMGTPVVLVGVGAVILLQLAFTYAPPLQRIFGTRSLDPISAGIPILAAGLVLFLCVEGEKAILGLWLRRQRRSGS